MVAEIFHITNVYGGTAGWVGGCRGHVVGGCRGHVVGGCRGHVVGGWVTIRKIMPLSWPILQSKAFQIFS